MNQVKYRPDIDGLRAIAVGVVMAYHAFPGVVRGGFVGVDVFFVISGYLISGIILDGLAGGRFTFANFYARRIRRIFPALTIVLAAILGVGWFLLYADDYARVARHAAAGAAFVSNLMLWHETSYFDIAADLKPLLHLWSLGIEEQFYLVWPLILVVAFRWRRGPVVATLLIGTVSFLLAIWTVRIDRTPAFFAPWTRFWELLAGALLAGMERDAQLDALLRRIESTPRLRHVQSVAGLLLIAAGVWLIHSTRVFPGLWVLLPVGGTALLIASGPDAMVNRWMLSWRPVVWIGLISYPLYLWHWPLLSMARIVRGAPLDVSERLMWLAVSVVLAAGTYQLVERPIRFGLRRRAVVIGLSAAMAIVCAVGAGIYIAGGLIDRPINRSDAARLVDYYQRLHESGLGRAYRPECDMLDWTSTRVRSTLDPTCTTPGRTHTVFLWGDSYAQALTLGLRASLPPGTSLAQVTTSACRPQIGDFDLSVKDRRCEIANVYAMDAIRRLRPDLVLVAQNSAHLDTDWQALTARVLELGARQVVVVGPSPVWQPALPRIYAEHHLEDRAEYVSEGLDLERFDSDRVVAKLLADRPHVTYVSLLEQLCRPSPFDAGEDVGRPACRARLGSSESIDLLVVDAGHLSPKGSAYLGKVIWKSFLAAMLE